MYRLNEQQGEIVARAAKVADEVLAPNASLADRDGSFPKESVAALAGAGLLGLNVPVEYGGAGEGLRTSAAALDEIAQRCASTGMIYLMHLCGVACYAAQPQRFEKELRAAARGEHLSTLAWSERGSRSHFWAPVSKAEQHNGTIKLSAEKSFVTSAGHADGYVVSTLSPEASGPTDTALYLLLKEDRGYSVSGTWDSLGLRANASAPMSLSGVEIGQERTIAPPSEGFGFMLGVVLPVFQLGNAAISVGICEAATQATVKHLTGQSLQHLGTRLADLPNLRARLARMRIETDRARAHLASAIDAAESGAPNATLMVLESKVAAAESALQVTDIGMKACGGAAFGKHLSLERNFRDARAATVMAPTSDVLHDFIGKALCGMELF